ncbi:YolD-like family protein [Ferroacidibacillus organovorans]|uniref:YolD-like family protein n=1 Tax=Ferroacidibacillus organovorans TaxID=1765683 RepID=A0A101XU03_9BACL|nr:YolD-like family protein [Ferroacidibacillus organovorans]KUO97435.1 hypothetical protein ATW55_06115 [Ferroacidibacillus organovorans]
MNITNGNIFAAMRLVLPEHRSAMETMERSRQRTPLPQLSEDRLEELQIEIAEAISSDAIVRITYWRDYAVCEAIGRCKISYARLFLFDAHQVIELLPNHILRIDTL